MYSLIFILVIFLILNFNLLAKKNKSYYFNETLHNKDFCKIIKFNRNTIPENLKCYLKKNLIVIMNNINKNLYISGNEIENIIIKYNKIYKNFIIDIFVWDTIKYYYTFLKIDFVIYKNIIILKSIRVIKDQKDIIHNKIGNYSLFLPKKDQDRNQFIKDNEFIQKAITRNKWIIPK